MPAHQPIKVVLKTAVKSTEYSSSTEFHFMIYNYRIWGFFIIRYKTNKKKAFLAHLDQAT